MIRRRWVSGPPAAWWRRELQLRDDDGWLVKRVGQVHEPDIPAESEGAAMAVIERLLADGDWAEVEPYPS